MLISNIHSPQAEVWLQALVWLWLSPPQVFSLFPDLQ